jgi:hypothetical protein
MTTVSIPLPPALDDHPELAVLAALDAALKASVFALIAAHPPMRDADQRDADLPDSYWVASVFVTLAQQLEDAIAGYHRVLERERRDRDRATDDLDFRILIARRIVHRRS